MKNAMRVLGWISAVSLPGLALAVSVVHGAPPSGPASPPPVRTQALTKPDVENQRKAIAQQTEPEIDKQRKEAEQRAESVVDKDAAAAISETKNALTAIEQETPSEATAALERASGKITILLARHPETALVPVRQDVDVIDFAPTDVGTIRGMAKAAERAIGDKDYPAARADLMGLESEIRVRTYNLPLATYPGALQRAARALDQNNTKEAKGILEAALDTVVAVDRVAPLPLLVAKTAITEAHAVRDKDKEKAQTLLVTARTELQRAKDLGYAGGDAEYAALNKDIHDLEGQLKGKEDTTSAFTRLKDRVEAFFKRQSETEHHHH